MVLSVFIMFLQLTRLHSPLQLTHVTSGGHCLSSSLYSSLWKVFSVLTWLTQSALICVYLTQFLNITSLGIAFLVHNYLLSEVEIFHFMFFEVLELLMEGLVIVVFLPLYVPSQFSHTTFSIVSLYF